MASKQYVYTNYVNKMRTKTSCYTSLYSFSELNENGRADYRYAIIDRAWWDFDAGERGGIEQVKLDVAKLINRLEGDVRVVATGRGFHVHQIFDSPVTGQNYRLPLEHYQRRQAKGLVTLDGVGFPEKMTRIPSTYNPKRGRWAVVINGREFADDPNNFIIPKIPSAVAPELHPYGVATNKGFDFIKWCSSYSANTDDYAPAESVTLDATTLSAGSVPIMPCLARSINEESPNHHVRVALVQHMADSLRDYAEPSAISREQAFEIEDEIFNYIKSLNWKNWNPTTSRKGIKSSMRYKQVPSCAWFSARGMCAGKCWRYDGTTEVPE
jgi:hypothetical protein